MDPSSDQQCGFPSDFIIPTQELIDKVRCPTEAPMRAQRSREFIHLKWCEWENNSCFHLAGFSIFILSIPVSHQHLRHLDEELGRKLQGEDSQIRFDSSGTMQSDDLFIRKFRRQNVRPPLATVNFDPKREAGVVEWPPRRPGDGADADCSLTPSRVGLTLRSVGRGHIMQRSNSDVTLGDLDSSGKTSGKVIRAAGEKAGTGPQGDSGVHLHREYGSLSSLERQTQGQDPSRENHGPLSPNALRFKDPFLLLGLEGNLPEPDGFFRDLSRSGGDSPKPAKPPKPEGLSKKSKLMPPQIPQPGTYDHLGGGAWVRNFAHYDVQSILFDLTEVATNRDSIGRKKNITSGASAASQLRPLAQSTPASPAQGGGGSGLNADDQEQSLLLDEGDGNDNELLLSCPHFRNETGGEEQVGLGRSAGRRELWSTLRTPNDAVSVLEEPRESNIQLQGKSNYFIEHADLGAHYYRKYFNLKGKWDAALWWEGALRLSGFIQDSKSVKAEQHAEVCNNERQIYLLSLEKIWKISWKKSSVVEVAWPKKSTFNVINYSAIKKSVLKNTFHALFRVG